MKRATERAEGLFQDYFGHMEKVQKNKWKYAFAKTKRKILMDKKKDAVVFDSAVKCRTVEEINKKLKEHKKCPLKEETMLQIVDKVLTKIYDDLETEIDEYFKSYERLPDALQ